mgnify:CR=1 FL=1
MKSPKFMEVAQEIAARVHNGHYTSAQRLPSEYDLADEFGVSRLTVRKAIDALVKQQLLIKDPRKGTYVMASAENGKVESGRGGLQSFTEAALAYGKTPHTDVLNYQVIDHPSADIVKKLDLDARLDPKVVELERLRYWDDEPMTVEHLMICDEYVHGINAADFKGSLFELLAPKVELAYSHQEIEALLVDERISKLLQVPVGAPLLKVHTVTYTVDAKPVFYDTSYYRADKYTFKSTLTRFD